MTRRLASVLVVLLFALPLAAQLNTFVPPLTPDRLWTQLMAGNDRYVTGSLSYTTLRQRRLDTADHQSPPVTILSCSDSRVPPELIFDRTVGDLFVSRVAGNVVDDFDLASIEYAVLKGYTKLIVVMGHQSCGAVETALEGCGSGSPRPVGSPSLAALVARIREAVGGRDPHDVAGAVQANVLYTMAYLKSESAIIRNAVDRPTNPVRIVGAYYSFDGHVVPVK